MITFSHLDSNLSLEELELQVYNATLTDVDEKLNYCPVEITEENENLVEESCLATFDGPEDSNSKDEGLLPSISVFTVICVIAIIAFRRR
jgi:hypothetical protein